MLCPVSSHRLTIIVAAGFSIRGRQLYTCNNMLEEDAICWNKRSGVGRAAQRGRVWQVQTRGVHLTSYETLYTNTIHYLIVAFARASHRENPCSDIVYMYSDVDILNFRNTSNLLEHSTAHRPTPRRELLDHASQRD